MTSLTSPHALPTLSRGVVQGTAPNGTAALCNTDPFPAKDNLGHLHFTTGMQWQCVEYARRWLWDAKGLLLPNVRVATEIFFLDGFWDPAADPQNPAHVSTVSTRNGMAGLPPVGSLMIWKGHTGNLPGHVGVVVGVEETATGADVLIADQNRYRHKWVGHHSTTLPATSRGGVWTVMDPEEPLLGWVDCPHPAVPSAGCPPETILSADPSGTVHALPLRPFPVNLRVPAATRCTVGLMRDAWREFTCFYDSQPHLQLM